MFAQGWGARRSKLHEPYVFRSTRGASHWLSHRLCLYWTTLPPGCLPARAWHAARRFRVRLKLRGSQCLLRYFGELETAAASVRVGILTAVPRLGFDAAKSRTRREFHAKLP